MANQPDSQNMTAQAESPAQPSDPMSEQEIEDWDTFYQLLLRGELKNYGGEFIVVHQGKIVAHGADPEELRQQTAQQLRIVGANLVIPFVDNQECLTME
jgi:hypothetical protein